MCVCQTLWNKSQSVPCVPVNEENDTGKSLLVIDFICIFTMIDYKYFYVGKEADGVNHLPHIRHSHYNLIHENVNKIILVKKQKL